MPKQSTSSPPTLIDDPRFQDPEADVNVVSQDGVLFKVNGYYLKAHSPVIRDMLSLTNPLTPTEAITIPLPYPSLIIHHLLILIHLPDTPISTPSSSTPASLPNSTLLRSLTHWDPPASSIASLISLTHFLASPLLPQLLPSYLQHTTNSSAWPVFLCACGVGDKVAAAGAVGRFRRSTSYRCSWDGVELSPMRLGWGEVEVMGLRFYRAYCRAYFAHSHEVPEDEFKWTEVAVKFAHYLEDPGEKGEDVQ